MRGRIESVLPFALVAVALLLIPLQMIHKAGVPPIVVSCLSLALSGAQFFKDKVLPFDLSVTIASPRLEALVPGSERGVMILPAVFLNKGHGAGVVKDVRVEMRHESGQAVSFYPQEQTGQEQSRTGKQLVKLEGLARPFRPFPIAAQGSASQDLILIARDSKGKYLRPSAVLEEGVYMCELWAETDRSKLKRCAQLQVGYTWEDLIALAM